MLLSEFDFINEIKNEFTAPSSFIGIGDDCSVQELSSTTFLLTSKDLLIEDVHFLFDKISPEDLAHKAVHVNASDIAAMGGQAKAIHLGLGLPEKICSDYMSRFISSLKQTCQSLNIELIGGDTTRSNKDLFISVTIQGQTPKSNLKLRSSAQAGDILALTGPVGDSHLGLEILLNKKKTDSDSYFIEKHNRPQSHTRQGEFLGQFPEVHALIDISDGVLSEMNHILRSSNCGGVIHLDNIPFSTPLKNATQDTLEDRILPAISGGEDYCLLLTLPQDHFEKINKAYTDQFHFPLQTIGQLTKQTSLTCFYKNKKVNYLPTGFDHFTKRSY